MNENTRAWSLLRALIREKGSEIEFAPVEASGPDGEFLFPASGHVYRCEDTDGNIGLVWMDVAQSILNWAEGGFEDEWQEPRRVLEPDEVSGAHAALETCARYWAIAVKSTGGEHEIDVFTPERAGTIDEVNRFLSNELELPKASSWARSVEEVTPGQWLHKNLVAA